MTRITPQAKSVAVRKMLAGRDKTNNMISASNTWMVPPQSTIMTDQDATDDRIATLLRHGYFPRSAPDLAVRSQNPTPTDLLWTKPTITYVSGVRIEEGRKGCGPPAQSGDRVGIHFVAKLLDGTLVDSNTLREPCYFVLGAGRVIQGWEIGVLGMSAFAERRLTVPASLAYGDHSVPDVPDGSTVIFDIKLMSRVSGDGKGVEYSSMDTREIVAAMGPSHAQPWEKGTSENVILQNAPKTTTKPAWQSKIHTRLREGEESRKVRQARCEMLRLRQLQKAKMKQKKQEKEEMDALGNCFERLMNDSNKQESKNLPGGGPKKGKKRERKSKANKKKKYQFGQPVGRGDMKTADTGGQQSMPNMETTESPDLSKIQAGLDDMKIS